MYSRRLPKTFNVPQRRRESVHRRSVAVALNRFALLRFCAFALLRFCAFALFAFALFAFRFCCRSFVRLLKRSFVRSLKRSKKQGRSLALPDAAPQFICGL